MEVSGIPEKATVWAVVAHDDPDPARRWSRTTHVCAANGAPTTFELPPAATHVNLVCIAPLKSGQYVTKWCAPATVAHVAEPVDTKVKGFQYHEYHYHRIDTGVTVTGPATLEWMFKTGGHSHGGGHTEHMFTWWPTPESVRLGNPTMQYASACTFEGLTNAHVWCRCIGAAAAMAGIRLDGRKLPVELLDSLTQLALRAPAGKYVIDKDYAGEITDNRDHPSLTYGAGKDCDGWAQFFCQHFYAMRAVPEAEIANIKADSCVVTAAVAAHRRLKQYVGACMFFGRAVNPNKPGTAPFGHAWAGMLPPPLGAGPSYGYDAPTGINQGEPTAPLCKNVTAAMKRVYTAAAYPGSIDGVAFRGVRETLPKYYPVVQTAIGPTGSVDIEGHPPMNTTVLTAAQIETLCGDHQVADLRIAWLLWPNTPMRMSPYYVAPAATVDAAVDWVSIASPDDPNVIGFLPLLAGGVDTATPSTVLEVAPNVRIAVIRRS
jgi:hypothetical protein